MAAKRTAPDLGQVRGGNDQVGAGSGTTVLPTGPVPLSETLAVVVGVLVRCGHDRALERIYDAGEAVGHLAGVRSGYRAGYAAGVAAGRAAEIAEFEASLDRQNRSLVSWLPQQLAAVDARGRIARVGAR